MSGSITNAQARRSATKFNTVTRLVNDYNQEVTESHAGKVVERHWCLIPFLPPPRHHAPALSIPPPHCAAGTRKTNTCFQWCDGRCIAPSLVLALLCAASTHYCACRFTTVKRNSIDTVSRMAARGTGSTLRQRCHRHPSASYHML